MRKIKEGRVHDYTSVEETSKDAPEEKETRSEYYRVSALSIYLIIGEYTWLIDSGASKHISRYKGAISNIEEKHLHAW